MIIVSSMRDAPYGHNSSHCILFNSHKHGKMNSYGYADYGFDFKMESVTIVDYFWSIFESIKHTEYLEIKEQEYSKLEWV